MEKKCDNTECNNIVNDKYKFCLSCSNEMKKKNRTDQLLEEILLAIKLLNNNVAHIRAWKDEELKAKMQAQKNPSVER